MTAATLFLAGVCCPAVCGAVVDQKHSTSFSAGQPVVAHQRHGRKKGSRSSAFIDLGRRIENGYLDAVLSSPRPGNALSPEVAERILIGPRTRWAFARIPGRSLDSPSRAAAILPPWSAVPAGNRAKTVSQPNLPLPPPFARRAPALFQPAADDLPLAFLLTNVSGLDEMAGGGDPREFGSDNSPLGYRYTIDKMAVNAGLRWIHDLGDTTGTARAFSLAGYVNAPESMAGVDLMLGATIGSFSLSGSYIRGIDQFSSESRGLHDGSSDPVAWSSELAYATALWERETVLSVGYLKSSQGLQVVLPDERFSTKATMALSDDTTFSLEYFLDRDFSARYGDEEGYGITTKIGFGF